MVEEVKLSPGWLLRDVRRAYERLDPSQHKYGASAFDDRQPTSVERSGNATNHQEQRIGSALRSRVAS